MDFDFELFKLSKEMEILLSSEMQRGNDILVEIENLNFEMHQLNERMQRVYLNTDVMVDLLQKSREIRKEIEVLEVELKGLM